MSKKWAIIADDFTGAGDSAVQFVSYRKPVFLVVDQTSHEIVRKKLETVVVDTDTRFWEGEAAYRKVAAVTHNLYELGYRTFFKKIDSTLRGNIADEISAVMDAGGFRFAVVAPAAPRNKRTVVDGICMIEGVPLAETAIGKDPFTPVSDGRISSLLQRRFSGAIEELNLACIRSGTAQLIKTIREGLARGVRAFIADAELMDDLKAIATLSSMPGILFVGSSGLAEAVANGKSGLSAVRNNFQGHSILFTIGSLTEKSMMQCNTLLNSEVVGELVVDTSRAIHDPQMEMIRLLELMGKLRGDCPLLLRTDHIVRGGRNGSVDKNVGILISQFLGDISREIVRRRAIKLVFASGGDTAARIVEALETDCIRFVSEIIPGIPFGYFNSAAVGRRIYFVSKSGGFGEDDAMLQCLRLVSSGDTNTREKEE
jgi:uncharacterized protein YgbK (DUF1537 family)